METHNSTHTDQFPYMFFYLLIHLPPPSLHPNSPFLYLASSRYCYGRRMKCNQRPKWVPHVLLRSVFIESFSRSVCFHELLYCIYLSYNYNPLIYHNHKKYYPIIMHGMSEMRQNFSNR